jgi:cell division protein FtsB
MNFASINFARKERIPIWVLLALVLLLGLAAWGGVRYVQANRVAADAKAEIRKHQQLASKRVANVEPVSTASKEQISAVNEAIAALNIPWPALLAAIETARPSKIALNRVEPKIKDQRVLITAQAQTMDELIDFMRELSSTAPFFEALPVRQELVLDTGLLRKQATFEVRWSENK